MSIAILDGATYPPCSTETCRDKHYEYREFCKKNHFDPWHVILLCDVETGTCCLCQCNGTPPKDD
jgi:hypothetical protein